MCKLYSSTLSDAQQAELLEPFNVEALVSKVCEESYLLRLLLSSDIGLITTSCLDGAYDKRQYSRDYLGRTPIYWAVLRRDLRSVQVLVKGGSSLTTTDYAGNNLLHVCVNEDPRSWAIAAFLLQRMRDHPTLDKKGQHLVNSLNKNSICPWHLAISKNVPAMLRLFSKLGDCNWSLKTGERKTALHLAARGGVSSVQHVAELLKFLPLESIDPQEQDAYGWTVEEYMDLNQAIESADKGHLAKARYLRKHVEWMCGDKIAAAFDLCVETDDDDDDIVEHEGSRTHGVDITEVRSGDDIWNFLSKMECNSAKKSLTKIHEDLMKSVHQKRSTIRPDPSTWRIERSSRGDLWPPMHVR